MRSLRKFRANLYCRTPPLRSNIFVIENGRKSDFSPATNLTTSLLDVASYRDFWYYFMGESRKPGKNGDFLTPRNERVSHAGLGDQPSSPGTSSSKEGNVMRSLLGSCVRFVLVAGPARNVRSHGT